MQYQLHDNTLSRVLMFTYNIYHSRCLIYPATLMPETVAHIFESVIAVCARLLKSKLTYNFSGTKYIYLTE